MTMTARFPSRCKKCGNPITIGALIERDPGTKRFVHQNCTNAVARDANTSPVGAPPTDAQLGKLTTAQLRVMASMLGMQWNKMPGKKSTVLEGVKALMLDDPQQAIRAYQAVAHGQLSTPQAEVEHVTRDDSVDEVAEAVQSAIAVLSDQARDDLRGEAQVHLDMAIVDVQKRLEAAAETLKKEVIVIKRPDGSEKVLNWKAPEIFKKMCQLASIRENIVLVGPSGSGKTFLAEKLAEALDLPYGMQSCSAGISESALLGTRLPGESGAFEYIESDFVRVYRTGGVFLLDEMDGADPQILMIINGALANGYLTVPGRAPDTRVERHVDFVCIAAANTYGQGESTLYAGREIMDGATFDRFRAGVVFVNYDRGVEEHIGDPAVLKWAWKIRKAIERHGLEQIMSTRVIARFTLQKRELGYGKEEWEAAYFANWSPDERAMV